MTANPLTVGVVTERTEGERRVALVPDVVRRIAATGVQVVVEPGAGAGAAITDAAFVAAGASIDVDGAWDADVVVKVAPPSVAEVGRLRAGSVLIGFLAPATSPELLEALTAAGVTAFALELVPRISRAQSMDALSSQAAVAGYRGVLLAAEHLTRFFPMLTTAAGTVPPARVLVMGAGVAGLQALAVARRLGARTTGYDVRPEAAGQVKSVGANWLDVAGIDAAGEGGYARDLTDAEREAQQAALTKAIGTFDAVITTAAVPGRAAPTLVTAEAVSHMRPGSVVVDLAADSGGNCALSRPGEVVVHEGVTIVAPLRLAASLPEHASQLYARNVQALLDLMLEPDTAPAALRLDLADEVLAAACVSRGPALAAHAPTPLVEKAVI
ncbi:MAG: NAD(P) transhydrogenase subunit alpha [Thermoleophilia bacterium]